ncbi:hypothetical protein FA10DRAFT_263481 [Acaromyces ingoldii]|uniref:PIPK domain-containing protein n=1 Tax=Acaromyces ingoldii TaxID=215250 RepID=A0A316YXD0_9BASI|nr:hypothetical protein FA10DRAFT_263481 [Acaromyces ingoldii]PWN92723.1 hypothetical protein FA10DRAFT_263481 [Acaromyces ingoldii]
MDQIDFDTEKSLQSALDARAAASSSSSKSSGDPASINLSLPTRKRLIRKPLPDVPNRSASASVTGGNSNSNSSSTANTPTLGEFTASYTEMQGRGTHSDILGRHDAPRHHAATLEASRVKAKDLVEKQRIELSWWPDMSEVVAIDQASTSSTSSSSKGGIVLNQDCRIHLVNVLHHCLLSLADGHETLAVEPETLVGPLEACIATLTEPQALSALQRTASVWWRVDALVRSSEQQCGKGDNGSGALGMRWPRLAWRGGRSAGADAFGADSSLMPPPSVPSSTMRAARKRDVAMRLLSNAFWMAGVGIGDGAGLGIGLEMATEAALSAPATPVAAAATPKKPVGAAPNLLLRGAAPTVALSKAGDDEEQPRKTEGEEVKEAGEQKKRREEERGKKDEEKKDEGAHADEHSTLTERLAMQLKSGTRPGSKSTSPDRASRSSTQRDAESDVEEAKMTVCKVCVNVHDNGLLGNAGGEGGSTIRRRRSGTATMTAAERRQLNASTRSDATLKFRPTNGHAIVGHASVLWQPNEFHGNELFLNPLASDVATKNDDRSDGSRINFLGGTFDVQADTKEHADTIGTVLDVGLYVACSMALEEAFLHDCSIRTSLREEELPPNSPPLGSFNQLESGDSSAVPVIKAHDHLEGEGIHSNDLSERSYTRWSRGFWNMIQSSNPATPAKDGGPGSRHSVGFPRTRTTDSASKGSDGRKTAYTRLGRMITSFGGSRRPATAEGDGTKSPVVLEEDEDEDQELIRQRRHSESNPMDNVKTASLRGPPPSSVSPHISRAQEDVNKGAESADGAAFLDNFLDRQTFALLVEGLGGPLGSSAASIEGSNFKGRRMATPSPSSKTSSTREGPDPGVTSSTFSVASSQRTASTAASKSTANTTASTATSATTRAREGREGFFLREVNFYQHGGPSRDVSLGQAIEEAAARAMSLSLESEAKKAKAERESKKEASGTSKRLPEGCSHSVEGFKVAQFVHASDRISMFATVLPPPTPPKNLDDPVIDGEKGVEEQKASSTSNAIDIADVAAVAKALRTDHDTARAAVALAEPTAQGEKSSSRSMIHLWTASMRTGNQTTVMEMTDATYLLSFGKFLEAIVMHPKLFANVIQSGEHLVLGGQIGIDSKFDLVRLFKLGRVLIKIQVQPIALFNLLIEGPVVITQNDAGGERMAQRVGKDEERGESETESERGLVDEEERRAKKILNRTRLEVQRFFASIKEQISSLEHLFVARELDERGNTVKATTSKGTPIQGEDMDASSRPLTLLSRLKTSLRAAEFDLYSSLKDADAGSINDVRKLFLDLAKSSKQRLEAWAKKHLTKEELSRVGALTYSEPDYALPGRHAFPGSHIVVREDEPLSIIAFSLSSADFRQEVNLYRRHQEPESADKRADVLQWRTSVAPGMGGSQLSSSVASSAASTKSSTSTATSGATATGAGEKKNELDPDLDEVFHQPEPVRVHMKRKKRTRDASILSLTLRRVGSSISSHSESRTHTPATEQAPSIEIEGAGDDDETASSESTAGEAELPSTRRPEEEHDNSSTPTPSRILGGSGGGGVGGSSSSSNSAFQHDGEIASMASNDTFKAQITQVSGKPTASLSSLFTASDETKGDSQTASSVDTSQQASEDGVSKEISLSRAGLPDQTGLANGSSLQSLWSPMTGFASLRSGRREPGGLPGPMTATSRMVSDSVLLTSSSLQSADLHVPSSAASASGSAQQALPSNSSTPRAVSGPSPASPHVKHNLFHGNTKVSCVSWFAEDFAALRQKWGVTQDFVESLSRCKSWSAAGGKSKSGFFMTLDEQWIAKQLLTVWSVDEKEAFLEFAPAYLRYMMNSVQNECPTLLVKIAGVYSIKIKDVKTGETKLKMSVQVLENVFAGDDGQSIRFDLKGIRERRVKAGSQATDEDKAAVWWDGEWIDSFQSRAYVPEPCKALFRRALQNDLTFLTASNVMDYSLLVGVTEPSLEVEYSSDEASSKQGKASALKRKRDDGNTFRCRLVDFLGAWTLVKQLESSSKKALKQQAPTVIPPADYAGRFGEALDSYFVACPGATAATTRNDV